LRDHQLDVPPEVTCPPPPDWTGLFAGACRLLELFEEFEEFEELDEFELDELEPELEEFEPAELDEPEPAEPVLFDGVLLAVDLPG
jgi:hypothetical protein